MRQAIMDCQNLSEKELLHLFKHASSGVSQDLKYKRINCLEELQKRIEANSVQNRNDFLDVLFEMAITHGTTNPEKALIIKSLSLFIEKDERVYLALINNLKGQKGQLFIVFSELVMTLDYKKKEMAIKPLMDFLMTRSKLNDIGANEVYSHLITLGNQSLSNEIIREVTPFLDSISICSVLFSVRLSSEFADEKLLPKILDVLDRSMEGYFDAHHIEIERKICKYLKKIKNKDSFNLLMKLIEQNSRDYPSDKSEALGEVLNTNPLLMDDVLDAIYEAKKNSDLANILLDALEKVEKPPHARKLLKKIRIKYWWDHRAQFHVKSMLIKGGKASKPVLLELLQDKDKEKYEYALDVLKEIGVTTEETANVFPKPPMLQLYNFFYSHEIVNKKFPKDLNILWAQKKELNKKIPSTIDKLEHLILHILSSFNFVTLNIAPINYESVDILGFFPETLDLLIIGCTTGVLKDDLAKLDSVINTMEEEIPDVFNLCTITPIIAYSKNAAISPTDAKYAQDQRIVILDCIAIDKLVEMLNTNRNPKKALTFIKDYQWKHNVGTENFIGPY